MKTITQKPNWKYITVNCDKVGLADYLKNGVKFNLKDGTKIRVASDDIKELAAIFNQSMNGPGSCFIEPESLKAFVIKKQDQQKKKEQIRLLDGTIFDKDILLSKMDDDSFYYGELGRKALSSSAIKSLLDSPKEYNRSLYYSSDNPAFRMGRLIHLMALEPEKVESLCHVVDVQSRNTKTYKEKKEELGGDDFLFTQKEFTKAEYIADAVCQNQIFQDLTRDAEFEVPGFGIVQGFPFRAKADILGENMICDLKTTSDLKAFPYSAKKYGYDVQVYLYCEIFGIPYTGFKFFAIDKGSGDLGYYDVSEEFYESGKAKVTYALKVYKEYFVDQVTPLNEYVIKGTL